RAEIGRPAVINAEGAVGRVVAIVDVGQVHEAAAQSQAGRPRVGREGELLLGLGEARSAVEGTPGVFHFGAGAHIYPDDVDGTVGGGGDGGDPRVERTGR